MEWVSETESAAANCHRCMDRGVEAEFSILVGRLLYYLVAESRVFVGENDHNDEVNLGAPSSKAEESDGVEMVPGLASVAEGFVGHHMATSTVFE